MRSGLRGLGSRRPARVRAVLAAAVVTAALAGCGTTSTGGSTAVGGGGANGTGAAGGGGGNGGGSGSVVYHGSIDIKGVIQVSESFTDSTTSQYGVSSCASGAAKGNSNSMANLFRVPTPPQGDKVAIDVAPATADYKGPGSYPENLLSAGTGVLTVDGTGYDPTSGVATESLTVHADGSGTFTFSNVPTVAQSTSGVQTGWTGGISGTVTWTCSG